MEPQSLQSQFDALGQVLSTEDWTGAALVALLVYLPLAWLAINIALTLWLWPDAHARGLGRPRGWTLAFLVFGPLAVAFYLGARPPGRLQACAHCHGDFLAAKEACPHCGWDKADHRVHQEAIGDFTGILPLTPHF